MGQCKTLLERTKLQIRDLASFISTVVATFPAVQYGPLYYRELEFDKICALKMNKGNFDAFTTLSAKAKEEILWWKVKKRKSKNVPMYMHHSKALLILLSQVF